MAGTARAPRPAMNVRREVLVTRGIVARMRAEIEAAV
jgi:hypothetical protein